MNRHPATRHKKRKAQQLTKWKRTLLDDHEIPTSAWDSDEVEAGSPSSPPGLAVAAAGGSVVDSAAGFNCGIDDPCDVGEWRDNDVADITVDEDQLSNELVPDKPAARCEGNGNDALALADDLRSFVGCESDDEMGVIASRRQEERTAPTCAGVQDISDFFVAIQSRRGVPDKVMRDVVEYMRANSEVVANALVDGTLPTFRAMRQQALRRGPTVKLDICYSKDGVVYKDRGMKAFPKAAMAKRGANHLYTLYYISLADVVALHCKLHTDSDQPTALDLSVDGVPESKSGGRSIDILSVRFLGCRSIYSLAVLQPMRRGLGLGEEVVLEHFLEDLDVSGLTVRRVIADAPKRAALRGLKQHSAKYSCPYCKASKDKGVFPARTFGAELRTDSELRAIASRVDADDFSSDEDKEEICRGIKKTSPLARLEYLDLIRDIPCEPMHLIHLGIVRRILNLSFASGSSKAKDVKFKRSNDDGVNAALLRTKSLPEFSRRTRRLDIANYKAEEFRNVILGFWPAFLNALPTKTVTTWILTVYLSRAYNLPRGTLNELQQNVDLHRTLRFWYEEFEHAFGRDHCSYNVHVFSHMDIVSEVDDLMELSAVRYEDHYNILKRSYRPGTASTGMQALQNLNLAKMYKHSCKRPKAVSLMSTERVEDRYVFTSEKRIIKLTAVDGDEALTGRVVPVAPGLFVGAGVDLTDVWCFKAADVNEEMWDEVTLALNTIVGKCVLCEGIFSVFTFQMLEV